MFIDGKLNVAALRQEGNVSREVAIADADLKFIEPHSKPVRSQAPRDSASDIVVLRAVTQEYVVLEIVSHASPARLPAVLIFGAKAEPILRR